MTYQTRLVGTQGRSSRVRWIQDPRLELPPISEIIVPVRKSPPTWWPVTRSQLQNQLRLSGACSASEANAELTRLIVAATDIFEQDVPYAVQAGLFTWQLDKWPPGDDFIKLPIRNVTSVDSVKYIDRDGVEQTLDPSEYRLDLHRIFPLIWRADLEDEWPEVHERYPAAITIEFNAGWSQTTVPTKVQMAIMALASYWWSDRGMGADDTNTLSGRVNDPMYQSLTKRMRARYLAQ